MADVPPSPESPSSGLDPLGAQRVACAYLLALAALHVAGWRMALNRDLWHLLDTNLLQRDPLGSLWNLHSQPPGMNALVAAALRVHAWTGLTVETCGWVLYALLGLAAVLALADATARVTGSRVAVFLSVAVVLTHPGFHLFAHVFFYEFLLFTLVALLLWTSIRVLEEGAARHLMATAALLGAMTATRSLYHPVFALVGFVLLLAAERVLVTRRGEAPRPGRPRLLAGALLLVASTAWPLKNAVVFGRPFVSSWTGYNLTNGLPVPPDPHLAAFFFETRATPEVETFLDDHDLRHPAVSSILKTDGNRVHNWNHGVFLMIDPSLRTEGWRWRQENPGTWARVIAAQYAMATRASFVHPYTQRVRSRRGSFHRAYAETYRALLFLDLRPAFEAATPGWFLHHFARIQVGGPTHGHPVPYTLFGVVLAPGLFLTSLTLLGLRWKELGVPEATLAGCLLLLTWSVAVPCLTDGQEANRMRFATLPALVLGGALVAAHLPRTLRAAIAKKV